MKTHKIVLFFGLLTGFFMPEMPLMAQNPSGQVTRSFSYEVNAQTTLDELHSIEKQLKDTYSISARFTEVEIENAVMKAVRVEIETENQQFSRFVRQSNGINPFQITLTESGDKKYRISLHNATDESAFTEDKNTRLTPFGNTRSFFDDMEKAGRDIGAWGSNIGKEAHAGFKSNFESIAKEMEEAQHEIQQWFKKPEDDPEAQKETFTDEDGNTTTVISRKSSSVTTQPKNKKAT